MRSDQAATAKSPLSKTPSILRVSFQFEPHQSPNSPQKHTRMENAEGPGSRVLAHLGLGLCSRAPLRDVAFSIFAFANATWHLATLHTPPPPPARLDKPKDARLGQGSSRRRTAEAKTVSAACGLSRMQRGGSNQTTQRRQQVNKSLHRVDIASTATSQSPSGGCTVQSTSVYDKH